jgi:hypothetical protein
MDLLIRLGEWDAEKRSTATPAGRSAGGARSAQFNEGLTVWLL